jgi:hypothetical protein
VEAGREWSNWKVNDEFGVRNVEAERLKRKSELVKNGRERSVCLDKEKDSSKQGER